MKTFEKRVGHFVNFAQKEGKLIFEVISLKSNEVLFSTSHLALAQKKCLALNSSFKGFKKPVKKGEKEYRLKLLALIHCDEEYKQIKAANAWEDWLMLRFGVSSCKELNEIELKNVLDILTQKVKDRDFVFRKGTASDLQIKKICAIMKKRRFKAKAREDFVKKQIGLFKPFYLLNKDEASKIITGLQKIIGER